MKGHANDVLCGDCADTGTREKFPPQKEEAERERAADQNQAGAESVPEVETFPDARTDGEVGVKSWGDGKDNLWHEGRGGDLVTPEYAYRV